MKKTSPSLILGLITAISLIVVGTTLSTLGLSEESMRLTLRETARISTLIFTLIFIASPFHKLIRNDTSKWLMVNRRYLGIGFGVSHLIHLALIICLISMYSNGEPLSMAPMTNYIVGGIGYLLIFAMLATSNNQSVKYLGHKRWKRLHTFGMYYLLLAFLSSYIGLLEKDFSFYVPIVLILALACLTRAFSFFSGSTKKARIA